MKSTLDIQLMTVNGLDNLLAIFREYFYFAEFTDVVIYDEEKTHLSWHDVPDDPMCLREDLAEDAVQQFSRILGVEYRWIENLRDKW